MGSRYKSYNPTFRMEAVLASRGTAEDVAAGDGEREAAMQRQRHRTRQGLLQPHI